METLTVRKTRESLSQILKAGQPVMIRHPTHPAVLLPEDQYRELEKQT